MENLNVIEEKRRHKRAQCNIPLQYRNLKKRGEPPAESLTGNISEGGVSFKSNEFIPLACRLVVEMSLPAVPNPVKAITKVAWIRKLPSGGQYELGNQFLDMVKEDKIHITNFVSSLLNTTP